MQVRLLYFAGVRDSVGLAEERLELPSGVDTVAQLAQHLEQRYPQLGGRLAGVRFAIDEEFAPASAKLSSGCVVAVIPPVAGG